MSRVSKENTTQDVSSKITDAEPTGIDIAAHKLTVDYYQKTGQPEKAIPHLLRILPFIEDTSIYHLALGTSYLKSGIYDKALSIFSTLREQQTHENYRHKIQAQYGLTLFYLGRHEESREELEACLEQFPQSSECSCYKGQVEAAFAMPSEIAERCFINAIRWDSTNTEAWYQLGRYYMGIQQFAKSRDVLLSLLQREPLHAKAHSRLGMAYYYLNQPEFAEKSYTTALLLNPADFNTHYNAGELSFSIFRDYDKALSYFLRALELKSDHGNSHYKAGLIYLNRDMLRKAAYHFSKAAEVMPDNIRVLLQLAVTYEKLNLIPKAVETYQKVAALDELNHIAHQKLQSLQN